MNTDTTIRVKKTTKEDFKKLKDDLGMTEDGLVRHLIKRVKR